MRWLEPPYAPVGSTRVRTFFAWLPVDIGRETRWLERVTVREEYVKFQETYGLRYYWLKREFVDGKVADHDR